MQLPTHILVVTNLVVRHTRHTTLFTRVREGACHPHSPSQHARGSSGAPTAAVVIGEVVMAHVAEAVAGRSPTGKLVVDPVLLRPVCRLGGVTYGRVTELYDIPRPGKDGSYPPPPPPPPAAAPPQQPPAAAAAAAK
jgi:hypothetical protein